MSNTEDCGGNMGISVAFSENKGSEKIRQAAPQLFIILLLNVFGIVLTFTSAFRLPYNMMILAGLVILYTLIFSAVFLFIRRKGLTVLSITVLFCLICIYFKPLLYEGFEQTIGWIGEVVAEYGDKVFPWVLNTAAVYEEIPMTIFFAAALFPLVLMLSYAVMNRLNIFLLLLIAVPVLEMTLFYGCLPSVISFVFLVLGSFSLFILNQSAIKRRKYGFDVRSNSTVRKQAGNLSLITAVLAGILIMVLWLFVSESDYTSFTDNFSLRSQAGEKIKKTMSFTYEEKTPPQGGIAGGQFSKTDKFSFTGDTVLTVEADSLRGSIYLKGYVGGDYTEKGWKPLPNELANQGEKLSKELQSWNLPSEVIKYDDAMLSKLFHAEKRFIKVTKTDNSLLQYQYVPYFLSPESAEKLDINEQGITADDKSMDNNYSALYYDVLNYDNNLFLLNRQEIRNQLYGNIGLSGGNITTEQLEKYFREEEQYADFVNRTYTRLPESLSGRMIDEFSDYNKNLTVESVIKKVMGNLSGRATYTLTPGETPDDKDYVDFFLYENQKGYCTHFASAATVIFRMCGIPARYVEGYVVTVEDYTRASRTDEGRYVMDIKDTNSHAWCEIYLEGFGWVPVEVTPGLVSVDTGGSAPAGGESIEYETNEESELNDIPMEIPQIEYTPTGNENDNLKTGTENSEASETKSGLQVIIMTVILLPILLCIIMIILRRRAVKWRINQLNDRNLNYSGMSWYEYVMDVLDVAAGRYLMDREISDLAWAAEMEKKNLLDKGTFISAIPVVQKCAYSENEISISEYQYLIQLFKNAVKHLYKGLTLYKKFKWRYIDRLPVYKEISKGGKKH